MPAAVHQLPLDARAGPAEGQGPVSAAKLVRDRIPEIIEADGLVPRIRVAAPEEYRQLLRAKLVEEVSEFLDSEEPEELADVLEVIHALVTDLGVSVEWLEDLRRSKARERGTFTRRLVWSGNGPGQVRSRER